ncbi:MAG: major capsid protein [Sulfolobaceae archaeon]
MSKQIKGLEKGTIQNNNLEQFTYSGKEKTTIKLEPGKSAITMQGNELIPIMWKEILAGEYIKEWKIDNLTRIITPLVPTMDKVFIRISAFFVPNTRVWKDAEKAQAAKYDLDFENGKTPKTIPMIDIAPNVTQKDFYKFMLLQKYGIPNNLKNTININVLPLRGYQAIYNDYIRNKDYEPALPEWNDTIVSGTEKSRIRTPFDSASGDLDYRDGYLVRNGQTRKNYWTNIKRTVAGSAANENLNDEILNQTDNLFEHLDWETKFQELRQRADNANRNDWDIIAEMGGTAPVKTDRVEYLGDIEYELNYQQITQSAPVIDNSTPLGTTGSFSYTRANGTLFRHKEFKQNGYIHVLIQLNMDKYYESGVPRELLKINIDDIYRPGLAKTEYDIIYGAEISANGNVAVNINDPIAYKPKWSEYKRLPILCSGEMQSETLTPTGARPQPISNSQWHNMLPSYSRVAIMPEYFNNGEEINQVLARNNVMQLQYWGDDYEFRFIDDPVMNMSEHTVIAALPIEQSTLGSKEKANTFR